MFKYGWEIISLPKAEDILTSLSLWISFLDFTPTFVLKYVAV